MANSKPGWPTWTNAPITLYHGTLLKYADIIAANEVDITLGRNRTDFGAGFYTTTSVSAAREWSRKIWGRWGESEPAVVKLEIDRWELGKLSSICFVRHSLDETGFWSFVRHCRTGQPHIPYTASYYDVACGPIARLWDTPSVAATLIDSDQTSFHTLAAQAMLNDKSISRMEVFA